MRRLLRIVVVKNWISYMAADGYLNVSNFGAFPPSKAKFCTSEMGPACVKTQQTRRIPPLGTGGSQ